MINLLRFRAWWHEVMADLTIFGLPLTQDSMGWDGATVLAHLKPLLKKEPTNVG